MPEAYAYCRVLGGVGFFYAGTPVLNIERPEQVMSLPCQTCWERCDVRMDLVHLRSTGSEALGMSQLKESGDNPLAVQCMQGDSGRA